MSAYIRCDAPGCGRESREIDHGWVSIELESSLSLIGVEPRVTVHACGPRHAVFAVGAALGVELVDTRPEAAGDA